MEGVLLLLPNQSTHWKTLLPCCYEDIRRSVLRGKISIHKNMPEVRGKVINNHAYFSAIEILEVALGMGFDVGYLPDYNKFSSLYNLNCASCFFNSVGSILLKSCI